LKGVVGDKEETSNTMKLTRPGTISIAVLFSALLVSAAAAQDTHYPPDGAQIPPSKCLILRDDTEESNLPCSQLDHQTWLADITRWRNERRIRVGLDSSRYTLDALKWTRSSFIQPQMMVHDRYFYDVAAGKYTVDRYLKDLDDRYGGIDAVLVWATYPNLGIDDRNQLDMWLSMPGALAGLRQMIADFHRRGVRVLFPMMMWDEGTRDPGKSWQDAIAELMKEIDADGINGDTQDGVPLAFSLAAEKIGHPLAFEPEHGPHDEGLAWNLLTWGNYRFQRIPTVDRFRWLEPRHQVNVEDRWSRDKTDNLQFAFFNGEGWQSWENIWGIWNGITPRDGEAIRRVATIERAMSSLLVSQHWEPFYPMEREGVYASRWPQDNRTLWTIVNRNEYLVSGLQMNVEYKPGVHFFDLYHGLELQPEIEQGKAILSFPIEGHGFGAILAVDGQTDASTLRLMAKMKATTAKDLASYPHVWTPIPQHMVDIPRTSPAQSTPPGMIRIEGGDFLFKVNGIEIEGSNDAGTDVQYPWEDTPRRFHVHPMRIPSFYIDKYPVTNAEFKKFIDDTHYAPRDTSSFLKDWVDGSFPEGAADQPVTWVSLEDAREYARWAGKRLPHEWEWQYAAQGRDGRIYPWGNCDWLAPVTSGGPYSCPWQIDPEDAPAPPPDTGRVMAQASNVEAHPRGASPFGAMDMVGNAWQWTDEYLDDHTRAAILRGGSHYRPQGSKWYFPQAYRNDQHGKLLLMSPGYDRSGAIGFRCVKDSQ